MPGFSRLVGTTIAALSLVLFLGGCEKSLEIDTSYGIGPGPRLALSGHMKAPEGSGPFPAIILMHGCTGLDQAVRRGLENHASYLVEHGFVTLILDSFGPRGFSGHDGRVCEFKVAAPANDYRVRDAFQALRFLRAQPNVAGDSIFLMGQSHGASVAISAAAKGDFASQPLKDELGGGFTGVVAYYPFCAVPMEIETPTLVLAGQMDDWTPSVECERAKSRVRGAAYEVVVYPGQVHSFDLLIPRTQYRGRYVGGNPNGHSESQEKMISWLKTQSTSGAVAPLTTLSARDAECWLRTVSSGATLESQVSFWRYATPADVKACIDERGRTFIHEEVTLTRGNDVGIGGTPIMWAIPWGNLPVVKVLLEAGSELSARSPQGQTPIEIAEHFGRPAIAELIRTYQ